MAEAAAEQKPKQAQPLTRLQRRKQAVRKRVRQSERRRLRNLAVKTFLKTTARRMLLAIEAKDVSQAQELYRRCSREYDKAASKGIIHPNAASRKKARLARRLSELAGQGPAAGEESPARRAKPSGAPATDAPVPKKSPAQD
jgi:small subunit ribosomal protein S20